MTEVPDYADYAEVPDIVYDSMDKNELPVKDLESQAPLDGDNFRTLKFDDHSNHVSCKPTPSMAMNSPMSFHTNYKDMTFLFHQLTITNFTHLCFYATVSFFLAILVEFIKSVRYKRAKFGNNGKHTHHVDTSLFLVQTTASYLLMLIVMTFHYVLCSAVVLGLTTGFYIFGKKKLLTKTEDHDVMLRMNCNC